MSITATARAARLGGSGLEVSDAAFELDGPWHCCAKSWLGDNHVYRQVGWSLERCKAECVRRGAHCLYISHTAQICALCSTCTVKRSDTRLPHTEKGMHSWKRLGPLAEVATANWSYGDVPDGHYGSWSRRSRSRNGTDSDTKHSFLWPRRSAASRRCAFNFDRCQGRLRVYVYATEPFVDLHDYMYYHLRAFIDRSVLQMLLVDSPADACLFICPIGFYYNERFLHRLPYWSDGENHLIWDPWDWDRVDRRSLGKAILVTTNSVWHGIFDRLCDISVPVGAQVVFPELRLHRARKYLAAFRGRVHGHRVYGERRKRMMGWHNPEHDVVISDTAHDAKAAATAATRGRILSRQTARKNRNDDGTDDENAKVQQTDARYFDLLNSTFSLIPDGNGPSTYRLIESMAAGMIPVFVDMGMYVKPFDTLVPWADCSLSVSTAGDEERRPDWLWRMLSGFSEQRLDAMRRCVLGAYDHFLDSHSLGNSVLLAAIQLLEKQRPGFQLCAEDSDREHAARPPVR